MRPSRVLSKLRAGETVVCTKTNLADSRVTELAALAGFDCVWTCMEHVPNDWSAVEKQVLAAKVHNTDLLVRVARGSYSDLIRPLEMDATGLMVPHVMGVADAKAIVRHTRFHPIGLRPLDGGNADGAYGTVDFAEYLRLANEQRFLILQIEDPEALDEIEEIASLPGVDMLFFGPGDFSQAIGAPGQMDHPRITEARKRVAEVCASKGIFAGTVGTPESWQEYEELGYRFINIGADVAGLSQYYRGLLSGIGRKAYTASPSGYRY